MVKNAGHQFITRVKFGVKQYDIELLDGSSVQDPSQCGARIMSKGAAKSLSGVTTEGQLLGCTADGSSSIVLADKPIASEELVKKLVAPNTDSMEDLDRKISMYVSNVLMPIVVKTSALVIGYGIDHDSLAVALGEAFDKLPVNARQGAPGPNSPRYLGIVSFPNVAWSAKRANARAYAVLEAMKSERGSRTRGSSKVPSRHHALSTRSTKDF